MQNIKNAIVLIAVGCSIVVYAHSTFITKDFVELIFKRLDRIEKKVDHLIGVK